MRSILGSFLEHSRLFRFGSPARGPHYFIGSADMMPRNLDRRMEVLVQVEDADLQARLEEVLEVNLADDSQAWGLGPDGQWSKIPTRWGRSTHRRLQEIARERSVAPTEPPPSGFGT